MSNDTKQEELISEYVDRWYLSEEGDSEALKVSSKAEMRRQMKAIVDAEVTAVLDETRKIIQTKLAEPDQQWTSDVIVDEVIQTIRGRYK